MSASMTASVRSLILRASVMGSVAGRRLIMESMAWSERILAAAMSSVMALGSEGDGVALSPLGPVWRKRGMESEPI